jgi:membrane carboxypeptidase/penicillin-binding protein
VVAVRLTDQLGVIAATQHARKFGFGNLKPVLSLPLGSNVVRPIDLAAGYCVFANQGLYSTPSYIVKVLDRNGNVLESHEPERKRVVSAENAYIITDMLTGVMEPGGTGAHLKAAVGRPVAGKTGTTDNYVDAWFAGYTPQLCCVVWVGFDQNQAVNLAGGTVAGPIWAGFLGEASSRLAELDFNKPYDIDIVNICLDSGLVATDYCPRHIEMAFLNNNKPEALCYLHFPNDSWWFDNNLDWMKNNR